MAICTTQGGILCFKYNQFFKSLRSSSAPSWLWSNRAHPFFCLLSGCHLFNTSLTPPVTYFTSCSGSVSERHPLAGLLLDGLLVWVKYRTVRKCNIVHLGEGGMNPALICVLPDPSFVSHPLYASHQLPWVWIYGTSIRDQFSCGVGGHQTTNHFCSIVIHWHGVLISKVQSWCSL